MGKPPNTVLQLSFISSPARAELTQAEGTAQERNPQLDGAGALQWGPRAPQPSAGGSEGRRRGKKWGAPGEMNIGEKRAGKGGTLINAREAPVSDAVLREGAERGEATWPRGAGAPGSAAAVKQDGQTQGTDAPQGWTNPGAPALSPCQLLAFASAAPGLIP